MNSEEYPDGFSAQELHFGVDLSLMHLSGFAGRPTLKVL